MSNPKKMLEWLRLRRPSEAKPKAKSVLVVGLGRFGTAVGTTLTDLGVDVLAIDSDPALVNLWANRLTHARIADGTCESALKQVGATEFDAAVVAIGTDIQASILSTAALVEVGVASIWAKAIHGQHATILHKVGAHNVIHPEREIGERVGHAINNGHDSDYFRIDEKFVLAELTVPSALTGQLLGETTIRQRFSVTVVCIKQPTGPYTYATSSSRLRPDSTLLVAGSITNIERFAMSNARLGIGDQ